MSTRNNKHSKPSRFARHLLSEWRRLKLPVTEETIVLAVSGGADSTALALAIGELLEARKMSIEVVVAHLDHGLRKSSKQDATWVKNLANELGFTPVLGHARVRKLAETSTSNNIEQTARTARYNFLERTARRKEARFVLTAHTMDDQAETVLLHLMRGSAGVGLSAMSKLRPINKASSVLLARPLLWARRSETEEYCTLRNVTFLKDEMNEDYAFARVRVRNQLIPLMRTFNNRIVEALARTADLLREDNVVLADRGDSLLHQAIVEDPTRARDHPRLNVSILGQAPPSLRRQAIRKWLSEARGDARRLEMAHILAVDRLLEGKAGGRTVELPNGARVIRQQGRLEFRLENN